MSQDNLVPLQVFPQIQIHRHLRLNCFRSLYARITNNAFCFRLANHRYIRAFRRMPPGRLSKVGERVVQDLQINGIAFAEFSEFFDSVVYGMLKVDFENYLNEFNQKPKPSQLKKGKNSFIDTIHKAHTFHANERVSTFLASPVFAEIASHYMKMIPRFVGSSFWRTHVGVASERVYSQAWHRDYNDRALVKVFLCLTDVGSQEGYFEYVTGSHGAGCLGRLYDRIGPDGYRIYPDSKAMVECLAKIPTVDLSKVSGGNRSGESSPWHGVPTILQCLAPQGTLIFADTFGFHRGGYVQAGHRDTIMVTYSTNFNIHKPHFTLTNGFVDGLNPFMRMVLGVD